MTAWEIYLVDKALQVGLTPQQREVFLLLFCHQHDRAQVSAQLGISANACQQCLGEIYAKFQVDGRGRGKEKALYSQLVRSFEGGLFGASAPAVQPRFIEVWQWLTTHLSKANRSFRQVDEIILRGVWDGISYADLAQESGHSVNYLKSDASRKLWALLSDVFGEKVGKKNARSVIETQLKQHEPREQRLGDGDVNPAVIVSVTPDWDRQLQSLISNISHATPDAYAQYAAPCNQLFQALDLESTEWPQMQARILQTIRRITDDQGAALDVVARVFYLCGFHLFQEGQLAAPEGSQRSRLFAIAALCLELVIQLKVDYQNAYYTLGELYLMQAEVSHAQADWNSATTRFTQACRYPEIRPWALNYLGYIEIKHQHYPEAEYRLTQALGGAETERQAVAFLQNPQELKYLRRSVLKNLGWAIFAQGQRERYPEAAAKLQAALDIDENYAAAHCLFAQVQDATCQNSQAAWQKCLQLASPVRSPEEKEWIALAINRINAQGEHP